MAVFRVSKNHNCAIMANHAEHGPVPAEWHECGGVKVHPPQLTYKKSLLLTEAGESRFNRSKGCDLCAASRVIQQSCSAAEKTRFAAP